MIVHVPITVTEKHCPYCDTFLETASSSVSTYGRKFRRCKNCKKIYKTGRFLFSDLSPSQIKSIKEETFQKLRIWAIVILTTCIIMVISGEVLLSVVLSIALYFEAHIAHIYFRDKKRTLDKLKGKDKELLDVEIRESERIQEAYRTKKKDLIIINSNGAYELKSIEEINKENEKIRKEYENNDK